MTFDVGCYSVSLQTSIFNCLLANMLIIHRAELPPLDEETGFYCIDEGVFARCITPALYLDGKGKIWKILDPTSGSAVDPTTTAVVSSPKRRKSLSYVGKSAPASVITSTQSALNRRKSFPSNTNGEAAAIDYDYDEEGQLETTLIRRKQSYRE